MNKTDKYVGTTIGVYKVISIVGRNKYSQKIYHVKCTKCGYEKDATYSCIYDYFECKHIKENGKYKDSYNYHFCNDRIRKIFFGIKTRCYNTNDKNYRWYGAKGIKVCDEWLDNPSSFEEWALNNGYADDLTIDRIDENKDYCPENCRWISNEENARYKSTTRKIDVDGEIHTGREWTEILGLGTNTINVYIRKYGKDNVIEFIKRYIRNPYLKNKSRHKKDIYTIYMFS